MRLETRTLYSLLLTHDGLGAPRARPPERSGDRGAPRATAKGGPRGQSPPDLKNMWQERLRKDDLFPAGEPLTSANLGHLVVDIRHLAVDIASVRKRPPYSD